LLRITFCRVSHELNNIAQVLRSALDLPSEGPAAETEADAMASREALTHVARHVTELARTILRIARPTESGHLETELGQTLQEVRDMLRLTGRIRHARVVLELPPEPCLILGNPVHAQQVFLNLINNAADAVVDTPEPSIEAGVRAAPGGRIEAWVQDNGPGIALEVLSRIFEPFFTTKAAGAGTGLGLPVVKQIVESWGGQIHVHSQPGIGTRIVLDLPAVPSPSSPGSS
jgi:signal transduction histidine kinase